MTKKQTVRLNIEVTEGLDDPLRVIRLIVESSNGIESMLRQWIRLARAQGHTWEEIAASLSVTRQSAWQRFRDVE